MGFPNVEVVVGAVFRRPLLAKGEVYLIFRVWDVFTKLAAGY